MSEQQAHYGIERKVPQVRTDLETLWDSIQGVEEPNLILEALQRYSGFLSHLQFLEQQLLPLISNIKRDYNSASDAVKSYEDFRALQLNDSGVAMNRAEKIARLESFQEDPKTGKSLRGLLSERLHGKHQLEDEYTDLKGFRRVVEEQMMTLRQKLKMLMEEYKEKPHVRSNPEQN